MADSINFQPIFDYIDQKNDELWQKMESTFVTKDEIRQIENKLDFIMTMVKKLDEERLVTIEWVRRIEMDVEKIKKHLQIV